MQPTFSIVIPAKNEVQALPHLLAELRVQTRQPVQIIVADAGSTDGTVAAAEAAGAIVVPGGLPGVGRNAGARVATGEYLVFLDADVYISDDRYCERLLIDVAGRGLDVGACAIGVVERAWWPRFAHAFYNAYVQAVWRFLRVPHAPGACLVVRRSVFVDLGGFAEHLPLAEDMDLALRAVRAGWKFGFVRGVTLLTDTRRMQTDGWLRVVFVYARMELALLFLRRIPIYHHYALDYRRPERKKVQ